jgi:HD-like signal output (HDOD) protein
MPQAALVSSLTTKLTSQHLPVIRQTSAQIITLLSSPNTDIQAIARTILKDLAFTARVLRLANSPYYRRRAEKITTITQAILQVGYTTLRDIAIAAEFADLAQKHLPTSVNLRRLLAKAFVAAQQASALGQAISLADAEALFTSALLESLGEFALATVLPNVALEIEELQQQDGLTYESAHRQVTDMTPHDVTVVVATVYQLPEDLILAPPEWEMLAQWTPRDRRCAVVHFANSCASNLFATESPKIARQFSSLMSQITTGLALPLNSVKSLLAQAFQHAMELGVSVDLDRSCFTLDEAPPDTVRYAVVRSCAQLAESTTPG